MSRRPRTQAVPRTAGSRSTLRPRLPEGGIRPRWLGRGSTIFLGTGLVLILLGLASVVAGLPAVPTETPVAGPLAITFGRTLDPDTFLVTDPTSRFEPGDPFAYSVNPPVHPGVANVYVSVVTLQAGEEVLLQPPSAQRLLPEPVSFGYETTTNDLIELFGYGRFTMRISLDPTGAVYAQGRFEVVEPNLPR